MCAFDDLLPNRDPLLCLGLALDIKAHIHQSLQESAGVYIHALKRFPLSTHSLLKRFVQEVVSYLA